MLWLALHLPLLPLEVFPSLPPPSAVVQRERVVVCDAVAAAAGVAPGMRLSSAWAVQPALTVFERDGRREVQALTRLACWAGGFTPEISMAPQGLLLELGASLRLFGGAAALFQQIIDGCREQGFAPHAALAPTPLAARWLAAGEDGAICLAAAELSQRLGALPLSVLALPPASAARLTSFGARTLGDVLRLPRAGLARRVGADFAADLARALGELPDPRPRFVFPARFAERLELPARVDSAAALGFAAGRLIAAMCGWLAARGSGVRVCEFDLAHDDGTLSLLALGFAETTRDPLRIGRVLRERLGRLVLAAPVETLALRAEAPEIQPGRDGSLFADAAAGEGVAALIERLQARLGTDSVHGLATVAEHRPEAASQPVPAGNRVGPGAVPAAGARPLWLLPQPEALPEVAGYPYRAGPLTLLAGPERIESGWWDSGEAHAVGDVRRDYFVAVSKRHEWLWVFRDTAGWFLHGVFA